jgi:hypothetical protein
MISDGKARRDALLRWLDNQELSFEDGCKALIDAIVCVLIYKAQQNKDCELQYIERVDTMAAVFVRRAKIMWDAQPK